MAYIEICILLAIALYLLYKWSMLPYSTLRQRGVPHDPVKPFLGNLSLSIFRGKSSFVQIFLDLHTKYKHRKVYGFYNLRQPTFMINNEELIRKIAIKEFDSFANHVPTFDEVNEPLLSRSLVALKDAKWKEMRNTLTPAFTGSKMRLMHELINACSVEAVKHIGVELKSKGGTNEIDFELKDFFTRFTNDVIASAAFGIRVNSFKDKDNEFITIGKRITNFSGFIGLKIALFSIVPKLMRALRVRIFDSKIIDYFYRLVFDAMQYRKQHKIVRPDMIHLLMEAKRAGAHIALTDDDLLAQCLLFFFAGFETVSTCLCFTIHELLMSPLEQQKLFAEISAMESELQGQPIDYNGLMKMKYLDMVISESLRKWPPAPLLDRVCGADITLKDDNENFSIELKKNDRILIPVIGIQHDPENFVEPLRFKPERFCTEHEIKPFTYMPFGLGPRSCIGNRLALMEVKSIIYYLILNFQIIPSEKTSKDLLKDMHGYRMQPKQNFWARFVSRNKLQV